MKLTVAFAACTAALLCFSAFTVPARAQHLPGYNYDEAKIAPYTMLDPLKMADGRAVRTAAEWPARRAEIVRLFEENVFGKTPEAAKHAVAHAQVMEHDDHALGGLAIREQVDVTFDPAPGVTPGPDVLRSLRLLIYSPTANFRARRPSPTVLGPNFGGNQTVVDDPGIRPTPVWVKAKDKPLMERVMPGDSTRGSASQQWQVKRLMERGYALVTFYYGDLEPDGKGMAAYSARNLFRAPGAPEAKDDWGAIGLWAWGLSQALDYLVLDPLIDDTHVAVTGHSRLGKTADWAAAQDPRFAAVLSNESGHGGQSIQRRALGETVAHLADSFPYWFAPAYAGWKGRDSEIPADGNLLLSLAAPRPVYVGSATGDEWSDPKGEFLAALSASRVYRLLGEPALAENTPQPGLDQPIGLDGFVAYHDRSGKHDVTAFDWEHYLDFLDRRWGKPLEKPAVPPTGIAPPAPAAHPATAAQVRAWREQIRRTLFVPETLPAPATETYGATEVAPGVTMERVSFVTCYGLRVPANIFRPAKEGAVKRPAIVVVNGHGADKSSWYSWYTGVLYAQAGAVVLTYDPIGEGERNTEHKDFTGEHDALVSSPASMPVRLGGLMVTDVMQAVSTLVARKDVDPKRVAVMGFSMGSFVSSLAGAADPRIHALLLVGGGDLDGVNGYWDSGHAVMCQAAPYKALRFLGDRAAVLYTLDARRGDTFVINGTNDTVVAIPTHGEDFFADMRKRAVALNGSERGMFTTYFDPGASHRPSWVTPVAAAWLNKELAFPEWRGKDVHAMPTEKIGTWATRVSAPIPKNYNRDDRDAGIVAIRTDAPLLTVQQTDVLPRAEWERRKAEFVYASWVARASEAAARD